MTAVGMFDQRVFLLASSRRASLSLSHRLSEHGIATQVASDAGEIARAISEGAGAAIVEQRALDAAAIEEIRRAVAAQPSWSEFPILVLTGSSESPSAGSSIVEASKQPLGNVLLMERSVHTFTLVSAVRFALRTRQRQYEMRDYLSLKLQESTDRLDFALDVAGLAMWELDLKTGNVVRSRHHDQIFGYPSPLRVWTLDMFMQHVLPELRGDLEVKFQECLARGEWENETQIRRADGAIRWIWARGRVSRDAAGNPVSMIGTVADVTERKRMQESLIQTEKLASGGRMAAAVAHEINNPLAVASNAVYLAATHPSASEAVRAKLTIAERELERVAQLTRQTLGFYRETRAPELLRLSDTIHCVIELYRPKLNAKGITLSSSFADSDCVLAVAGEIRQIVSNLLTNAIEAVPRGGRIQVRTACSTAMKPNRRTVRFTIADNGVGIASGERNKIFEPFFTTKPSVGTGLGLWVTRELTAKQGGTIHVRSRQGSGTVFALYFPAGERSPKRAGAAEAKVRDRIA